MSLTRDLEQLRLQERARRMEAVIRELRARAPYREARSGQVPVPLRKRRPVRGRQPASSERVV